MTYFTQGGYKVSVPIGVQHIAGSVIAASAKPLDMLMNRDLTKVGYYDRRLLDPQFYLAELDATLCSERCTRLATYGCFDVGRLEQERTTDHQAILAWIKKSKAVIGDFWTGRLPQGDDIDTAIRATLAVQSAIGADLLILPSPLTLDLNSDLALELDWLTRGLRIARSEFSHTRTLASVAISDRALRNVGPYENRLVSSLLDNISSREPDGVYLILELAGEDGYYCASSQIVGALMRFADGFHRAGLYVVGNYLTVAGLLVFGVGADAWCSGWYKSERRLQLTDCADKPKPGPSAFPAFYSHPLASEIHIGNDFMRVVDAGLLDDVVDMTPFSAPLLTAAQKGIGVASVAAWRPTRNRVTAARGHFAAAMARETENLRPLSVSMRLDVMEKWLTNAARLAAKIGAIGDLNPRTEILHQREWLKALREFRERRQI